MLSRKDIEYIPYTLSDVNVIELLIRYRYKYDDNLYLKGNHSAWDNVDGASAINEEVVVTYADLDNLIKKCAFNNIELKMIEMIQHGYDQGEVAKELNISSSTVSRRLKTIFEKIKKVNDWDWKRNIYTEKLGLKTIACKQCKEFLPATDEFFDESNDLNMDFQDSCRRCLNTF